MARCHAEPTINILLTRNLPFDSDIRQRSHTLMIPLHYLQAKLNKRTLGQFEFDVTQFVFFFFTSFFHMHGAVVLSQFVCSRKSINKPQKSRMIGYHLESGSSFEIRRTKSREWKNVGHRWTRGVGVLRIGQFSWTSYVYHS